MAAAAEQLCLAWRPDWPDACLVDDEPHFPPGLRGRCFPTSDQIDNVRDTGRYL